MTWRAPIGPCPWCHAHELVRQYRYGADDMYRCTACRQQALIRDVQTDTARWTRIVRRLEPEHDTGG